MENHKVFEWYNEEKSKLEEYAKQDMIPTDDLHIETKLAGIQSLKYRALLNFANDMNIGTDEILKQIIISGVHHTFRNYRQLYKDGKIK